VDHPDVSRLFPADVLQRARELRAIVGKAGTGAYTNSQGLAGIRQHVVDYITARDDGHPAFQGDVFLTNGASAGIGMILNALIAGENDGIMIPIPQYPIYSALIARLGGQQVGYELDEDLGWSVTEEELYKRLLESREKGVTIKGLALINPGNPTGQVSLYSRCNYFVLLNEILFLFSHLPIIISWTCRYWTESIWKSFVNSVPTMALYCWPMRFINATFTLTIKSLSAPKRLL
jgi:hypothetical protein